MPKNLTTILEEGFLIARKKYFSAFLLSFLGVISVTLSVFFNTQLNFSPSFSWILPVISLMVSQIFLGGLIFFLYSTHKNTSCDFKKAVMIGVKKLPALVMTLILYSLMVFIGTVAFIIPGLLLSILCLFAFILIYTDHYDPVLALVSSFKLSKDHIFSVSVIFLTLGLFVGLSNLLALMLGYLLSIYFSLTPIQVMIAILSLLTIINSLLVPITYSIMISLLQDIKTKIGSLNIDNRYIDNRY